MTIENRIAGCPYCGMPISLEPVADVQRGDLPGAYPTPVCGPIPCPPAVEIPDIEPPAPPKLEAPSIEFPEFKPEELKLPDFTLEPPRAMRSEPLVGVEVVKAEDGIVRLKGFIRVDEKTVKWFDVKTLFKGDQYIFPTTVHLLEA